MSKYLLQEDDCAPDAREYFIEKLKEKFGLDFKDMLNNGQRVVLDEGMTIAHVYKGYVLSYSGDDPYYKLEKEEVVMASQPPEGVIDVAEAIHTNLVKYNTGTPTEVGVYACRIPTDLPGRLEDKFFMWINNRWGYMGSDQWYRGKVLGWVGPLQRKM